jgi:hypothetical protein
LIGLCDEIELEVGPDGAVYEPFWFRTFFVMRWEIQIEGDGTVEMQFQGEQVNYPMDVKAEWRDPAEESSEEIFEVSVRTLRNCMFDGYADCPFYEQLQ